MTGAVRSLWVLLALLLAGCGFQLRGAAELPAGLERTLLVGVGGNTPIANDIALALGAAGGSVVSEPERATARLVILENREDRRVLTVDAQGRASEYELRYVLGYRLLGPEGEERVAENRVTVVRTYRFDPDNVLGTGQEQAVLSDEMRRTAVRRMLSQLSVAAQAGGGE